MPGGDVLRVSKTITTGDIGVYQFEMGRRGRGGRSCWDLPDTVSFDFLLSFICFLSNVSFVLSCAFP